MNKNKKVKNKKIKKRKKEKKKNKYFYSVDRRFRTFNFPLIFPIEKLNLAFFFLKEFGVSFTATADD